MAPGNLSLQEAKAQKRKKSSNGEERRAWTGVEDELILRSVSEFGPKWIDIIELLPGRTSHATRNRYHRLVNGATRD